MSKPSIIVIIFTHNRLQLLLQAMRSALNQTYMDINKSNPLLKLWENFC